MAHPIKAPTIPGNAGSAELEGKVALLVGADSEQCEALALALARKGADIAIVFAEANQKTAEAARRVVEDTGRQCLVIPQQGDGKGFAARAMRQIMEKFGRLDLFIDSLTAADDHDRAGHAAPTRLFPHFELVLASIDQIKKQKQIFRLHQQGISQRKRDMKLAQELKGLPIFTIDDGREIGKVQDIYLDQELSHITALDLGSEGFLSRKSSLIRQSDVITLGQDAILVQNANCVLAESEAEGLAETISHWQRLSALSGRHVITPGGTRIGRIGDIILEEGPEVRGFSLSQTFVTGPVADNSAIDRSAVVEPQTEDGTMTVDLTRAEGAELQIVNPNPFTPPNVVPAEEETVAHES